MSRPTIKLVYLVYREMLSAIFTSQVLVPLEEHRDVADVTLGLLTPIGQLLRSQHRSTLKSIESRCQQNGIQVGWLPAPPTRIPWLWSNSFVLRRWFSNRFDRDEPLIVRCRSSSMTTMAIDALQNFPGAKVVFDCRAAEVCESIQVNGMEDTPESRWSTRAGQLIDQTRGSERVAVTASAGITCLSNAMIRLLQARHPDVLADKFRLVPCCTRVDDFIPAALQRDSLREELGLQGKFVVTYLGSLNWLHLPAEMIRMYRIIRSLLPHAHFLAITTDPTKMQAFIQEAGLSSEEVTIRSVPPQDVPRWVAISDLGLCLLRTTERDRVCSPVKIAEYFSAGVPVIITPQQGDFSAIVSQQSLGVEVDLTEGDDQLTSRLRDFVLNTVQDPRAVRARCQQYAKAELSWSGITPRLAEWYHELLDLPREIPSLSGLSSDGDLP